MTQTGINMQSYNMRSLFQATRMEWVEKSGREWIITLDAGYHQRQQWVPVLRLREGQGAAAGWRLLQL